MKVSRGRIASSLEEKATKLQFVVSNQVTNSCCGLAVIFCGFISLLIGRETINIPEIFSGVHGFTGKTVIHPGQTGFVKGRYIGENIRLVSNVLDFTKEQKIPGILVE